MWIFAAVALVRVAMGVNTIFNGRTVAMKADGIPLDAYPRAAAQTFLAIFAAFYSAGAVSTLSCIRDQSRATDRDARRVCAVDVESERRSR